MEGKLGNHGSNEFTAGVEKNSPAMTSITVRVRTNRSTLRLSIADSATVRKLKDLVSGQSRLRLVVGGRLEGVVGCLRTMTGQLR